MGCRRAITALATTHVAAIRICLLKHAVCIAPVSLLRRQLIVAQSQKRGSAAAMGRFCVEAMAMAMAPQPQRALAAAAMARQSRETVKTSTCARATNQTRGEVTMVNAASVP